MSVDVCTISTPALIAFLLLPSLLGLGTIATVSRLSRTNPLKAQSFNIKLAALQTAPLAAGSLASLVILREPSPKLVLAVGALALIPLVQTLYASDVRVHTTTTVTTPTEGHSLSLNGHTRKGKSPPSFLSHVLARVRGRKKKRKLWSPEIREQSSGLRRSSMSVAV